MVLHTFLVSCTINMVLLRAVLFLYKMVENFESRKLGVQQKDLLYLTGVVIITLHWIDWQSANNN